MKTVTVRSMTPVNKRAQEHAPGHVGWSASALNALAQEQAIRPKEPAQQISRCGAGAAAIRQRENLERHVLILRDATPALFPGAFIAGWDLGFTGNEASPGRDDPAILRISPSLSSIAAPR
ncbi:hypothetical protein [Sphingopyxis flava]|uniref:hypothetical protein n=1 Tax=Sphingopyxis flava TaxID=1507287 RepID=UPI0011164B44|nr:hypothetical protein [Sphingopyxis flava]